MKLAFKDSYLGKLRALVGSRPLIVPGFRIIIEDSQSRLLMIKRSDNGMWGIPAGSPELGESIADCIRREVYEETTLEIEDFDCFGFASDPLKESHTYPNGDQIQNFTLLIYAKKWSGNPAINDDETTSVRFFAKDEFPARDLILAHEIASMDLYANYKRSGQFQWA